MKRCLDCDIQLTIENTYKRPNRKTLDAKCKDCRKKETKKRYKKRYENQKEKKKLDKEIEKKKAIEKSKENARNREMRKKENHQCYKCYWGRYIEMDNKYICMLPNCWGKENV